MPPTSDRFGTFLPVETDRWPDDRSRAVAVLERNWRPEHYTSLEPGTFDPAGYWRRAWPQLNYLQALGCRADGRHDLVDRLAATTLWVAMESERG